jgi:serine/threonine-protein kinase
MVVTYGTTMAKPAEAARWGEVARAAVERTGGPELAAQLELALAQADTDARQGDAALSHLDRALVATLQMSPPNPMFLAAIYNERGNAKQARGLPGEAGVEYRRAYEVTVAQLGPRHPRALVIETNIAASLMDLGRAAEALESLRRTAAQMEITFGADKQQTLMTKFNLGAAALEAGALDEAAAAFALAKAGLEKQVGPDHPAVIRARRGLATVASRRGDHAAARAELLAVLATQEAELGKESGDLVRTLMLLGQDYAADGKRREAEAYLARALALAEKVLGPQHVETAEVRAAQAAMR